MTTKECLDVLRGMLKIRKGEENSVVNALLHAISVLERIDVEKIAKVVYKCMSMADIDHLRPCKECAEGFANTIVKELTKEGK